MTRSRALEAVGTVLQRLRAEAAAAAARAAEAAVMRRRSSAALASDARAFNEPGMRSAFDCATSAARRNRLTVIDAVVAQRARLAEDFAREARAAMIPWAQLRRGLERRRARHAAKTAS